MKPAAPVDYPDVGLYHPRLANRLTTDATVAMPRVATSGKQGTVGLLLLRSYLLAGNTGHYDGVITALEARGLRVLPAFATGLDARPAVEQFFLKDGRAQIDTLVSLTGFSLVGGPAYNDAKAAEDMLAALDVPYLSVMPVEFQTLEQWGGSERGLMPVESTMMVAIPELDGCTAPMVFGGRSDAGGTACSGCERACKFEGVNDAHDMQTCTERADALAARVAKLVALHRGAARPAQGGLRAVQLPAECGQHRHRGLPVGVRIAVPHPGRDAARGLHGGHAGRCPDALRERIIHGNAERFGALANVHARIPAEDHVRRERWLKPIEAQWGPAPGRHNSDGSQHLRAG